MKGLTSLDVLSYILSAHQPNRKKAKKTLPLAANCASRRHSCSWLFFFSRLHRVAPKGIRYTPRFICTRGGFATGHLGSLYILQKVCTLASLPSTACIFRKAKALLPDLPSQSGAKQYEELCCPCNESSILLRVSPLLAQPICLHTLVLDIERPHQMAFRTINSAKPPRAKYPSMAAVGLKSIYT